MSTTVKLTLTTEQARNLLAVVREYANENPQYIALNGYPQDPNGAHGLMPVIREQLEPTQSHLESLFRAEISDRANSIDPDNDRYWYDLTYGWALGQGLDPEPARDFARFIRYQTDLA